MLDIEVVIDMEVCFKLKGSCVIMIILEFYCYDY